MTEAEELELLELEEQDKAAAASHAAQAPGYAESALRGGAQGASLGFADEIVGGVGSAASAVKNLSTSDMVKDYIANRDAYRARDTEAQTANPKTYMGGQFAGAFAPALAMPVTTGIRAAAGVGALLGGAQGIGDSTNDLTQGDFAGVSQDAALGATIGGATGGLMQAGINKFAPKAPGLITPQSGKGAIISEMDAPRLAPGENPQSALQRLKEKGYSFSGHEFDDGELNIIAKNRRNQSVGNFRSSLDESQVGAHDPETEIYPTGSFVNPDYRRKGIATAMYQHAEEMTGRRMVPGEDQTGSAKALWNQPNRPFGEQPITADAFEPSPSLQSAYPSQYGPPGSVGRPVTPETPAISTGSPPKSRLPEYVGKLAGKAVRAGGSMLGLPGYAAGEMAEKPVSRLAEKATRKGMDAISKAPKLNLEALAARLNGGPAQKFLGALQNAAQNGQASLAATHFILSQTEPEYQKATQTEER